MTEDFVPAATASRGGLVETVGSDGGDEARDGASADAGREAWVAPDSAAFAGLLQRIAAGDEAALATLYDATCGRVYGVALRILRNPAAAEEVTEDVFFQVWRQALRYDPARGQPLGWILTIARSRALDHLRRDDPAMLHPEPATLLEAEPRDDAGPQDLLVACRNNALLHGALAALEPLPRQMIALVFFRGLTHEEVATHAGLPLGTVKSHVRRALLNLRKVLAADLDRSIARS